MRKIKFKHDKTVVVESKDKRKKLPKPKKYKTLKVKNDYIPAPEPTKNPIKGGDI